MAPGAEMEVTADQVIEAEVATNETEGTQE
jgi:hypothetical protein